LRIGDDAIDQGLVRARPDATAVAHAAGPSRAAHARLYAAWDDDPVAALNARTARLITEFHRRHRSVEFRQFLDAIDVAVPKNLDVHSIMDHCGTHDIRRY
jgi:hypothetical protein